MTNRTTPPLSSAPSAPRPARETPLEYWRVERVARLLDVSKKRIYQLVGEKKLQAIRLGPRQMRILRASVDGYLSALMLASDEEA